MLIPKLPKTRGFEYQFKYYKPENEDDRRIQFRRIRHSPPAEKAPVLRLLVLFVVLVFLFLYLEKTSDKYDTSKPRSITVEEVIVVD
jgi:hypothetical protein